MNRLIGLLPLLLVGVFACQPAPSDPAATNAPALTPAATREPSPTVEQADRIVALTSISADILQRLAPDTLVGVSGSRLLNENPAFANVPRVSEGRSQPNLEQIVALKPDLVIGAIGFHDATLAKLEEMGIRTLGTEANSWESLQAMTRQLAALTGTSPDPVLQAYQQCQRPAASPAPSTLVLVSRQPILSPNKTSWAGDLLTQMQLANLTADLQGQSPIGGYVVLSPEKILQANPDVLLLVDAGEGAAEQLKTAPFWGKLKATQTNQVHVLDYYGLVNPGSVAAIQTACTKLQQIAANLAAAP